MIIESLGTEEDLPGGATKTLMLQIGVLIVQRVTVLPDCSLASNYVGCHVGRSLPQLARVTGRSDFW